MLQPREIYTCQVGKPSSIELGSDLRTEDAIDSWMRHGSLKARDWAQDL